MTNCTIIRTSQSFVLPNQPTPHKTLHLSAIDKVPGLRHLVRSLHVFKHGQCPGKVIKEALSKALVPYYPFAGRLVNDQQGEVSVDCNGEGVWFVEASSSCRLEDMNYFEDHPMIISQAEMFPDYVLSKDIDPLSVPCMIQVTEFACSGFVVGTVSVHTIADGLGASQFYNAIGDFARGQNKPTVTPLSSRHLIPDPPAFPPGPPPEFPSFQLQSSSFDLPVDYINGVKNSYVKATGKYCSTFDISTAKTWQSRVRAMNVHPETVVRVCFFANTRHLLTADVNPAGYYGNCFYPVTVTSTSENIVNSEITEIVRIVREAKARLPDEFCKWAKGEFEEDPYSLNFTYNSLFVSDWIGLGLMGEDFGWGKMMHILPFAYLDFMAVAIFGTPIAPKKGVRVMTQCVGKEHLTEFEENMKIFK